MPLKRCLTAARRPRAAQYLRMSTENQNYSIQNQIDMIAGYAARHGIDIVRTYADVARSGLSLAHRPELARLLHDAQSGTADFDIVLVYDVSRWGRFQDTDESAHHEFMCRQAGVAMHYCAEQFSNDDAASSVLKMLKRAMAAEYSRELSVKVEEGHRKLVASGFRPGAKAPYGLRRLLIGEDGALKGQLDLGQQKNLKREKVSLGPGPADEVATVRRVFNLFVAERRSQAEIVRILHRETPPGCAPARWDFSRVSSLLRNECYIGNIVYSRKTKKLHSPLRHNSREQWVRYERAFEPIVEPQCFGEAQTLMAERRRRWSDAEMLDALSALHQRVGRLTCSIIDHSPDIPSSTAYAKRFGSLHHAYVAIGHPPPYDAGLRHDPRYRNICADVRSKIVDDLRAAHVEITPGHACDLFNVDNRFVLRIAVVPCTSPDRKGRGRWKVRMDTGRLYDVLLAARLDETNSSVLDFYLLPAFAVPEAKICLGPSRMSRHEAFRITSLNALLNLAWVARAQCGMPRTPRAFQAMLGAT